jgi:HPr kinase/phosphorylase
MQIRPLDLAASAVGVEGGKMDKPDPVYNAITIGAFFERHGAALKMERLDHSSVGMEREIREPTLNRPGLALAGFFSYFAEKRIQVLGAAELSYLGDLNVVEAQMRCQSLCGRPIPCIVTARGFEPPAYLLGEAAAAGVAVFISQMVTMNFLNAATLLLSHEFAPTKSEYGSMVDILGVGTLIRGSSGVGKSECVLGLLERGHSLVSDDITRYRAIEGSELIGTSPDLTRHHMEVRGLGVINVMSIFGVGSVRLEKRLDLVVTLRDWAEVEDVDRIGLDQSFYEILGVNVPHVTIPVRTGRDLARLVEVAALDQKLKAMGRNSAQEFNDRLLAAMQQKGSST